MKPFDLTDSDTVVMAATDLRATLLALAAEPNRPRHRRPGPSAAYQARVTAARAELDPWGRSR